MVRNWKPTRLGDLISLKGGLSYKSEFIDKGNGFLVGMGCVSYSERFLIDGGKRYGGEFSETHRLKPSDLVIATRQQSDNFPILGFPAMVPESLRNRDVIVATNLYKITNNSDLSNRFIYWLLRSSDYRKRILECAKGTTVRMLTKDAIEDFTFLCPPKNERDAITCILDSLDDKIELNRRMNATLEAMASALFQTWFVHATAAGLPQGWRVVSLDSIAHFLNGLALQKFPPDDGESLPVIKIAQLRKGNTEGADQANSNMPSEYIIQDGDVLFSWSGSLEVEIWCGGRGALNQHLFKVTSGKYPKWFYFLWTRHHLPDFRATADGKATTMGHIQRHHLTEAKVAVPPMEELQKMDWQMSPLIEKLVANKLESRTLANLRDTLLPKLLSGKLSVENLKKMLPILEI